MPCSKRNGVAGRVALGLGLALVLAGAGPAAAQETVTAARARITERAVIGGTTIPTSGVLRLIGAPARTAGQSILSISGTGDVTAGALARADLPTPIAYEDEANVFTGLTTIASTAPALYLQDTDAAVDARLVRLRHDGLAGCLQFVNDAISIVQSSPLCAQNGGSVILAPFSGQVLPPLPFAGSLGSAITKWGQAWIGELNVETLIARDKIATTGGRLLVGTATELIETISDAATTIKTKHNNLANGDRIYLESEGRVEWMAVTSGPTRINTAGGGNLSAETGAGDWTSNGVATLAQTTQVRYRGAASLAWTWISGAADLYFNTAGMLAPSTQYTVSLYVRRVDGAAIVPSGSAYRMYIDGFNGVVVTPTAIDVGGGWYRLVGTGTTGATSQCCVGVLNLPTGVQHFVDAVQVEAGATVTDWSEASASYTVTRNLDASNANVWEAGSGIFSTGTTGNGWWDIYAIRGMRASTEVGPTLVANVRTGSTFTSYAPRFAAGNLNGLYGYGSTTFGVGMGDPAATHVLIDATNGFRIRNGSINYVAVDAAGNAAFVSGNVTIDSAGLHIVPASTLLETRAYSFDDTMTGGLRKPGLYYDEPTSTNGRVYLSNDAGAATAEAYSFVRQTSTTGHRSIIYQIANAAGSRVELYSDLFVDLVSQSTAGTNVGRYRFSLNNTASNPGMPWFRTDGNFLVVNGNSDLYLNQDVNGTVYVGDPLTPANDNVHTLGIPSSRWSSVAVAGSIGVGLTVGASYQIQLSADSAGKPTTSTWTVVSDRRTKRAIAALGPELERLRRLPLVTYAYNGVAGTPAGAVGVGAVADEVEPLYPRAVRWQGQGADRVRALDWHAIFVAHIKATQELADRVDALAALLAARRPDPPTTTTGSLDP